MSTTAFADTDDKEQKVNMNPYSVKIMTVSDAEAMISAYFKSNNINIEIGSEEYIEYLTDLLMFETDEELKKLDQYEDFKIYASEYLSELNNPSSVVETDDCILLNSVEQRKKIDTIKIEAEKEDSVNSEIVSINSGDVEAMAAKGYSDAKAVEYARKWAKSRNPLYKSYGADCTNYVSQCVKAGGKSMTKPSSIPTGVKGTTKYWYSVRYEEWHTNHYVYKWKESSSFINVADFYTYWKNRGIKTASYSSKAKLQNGVSVGDVVQLKNGKGKWFHSIIITGGSKGARTYCGHTKNRKDEPVKNISGAVSYRSLKF